MIHCLACAIVAAAGATLVVVLLVPFDFGALLR